MKKYKLEDMVKGWFIGQFDPSALKTSTCEVAVKKYKRGDFEPAHFHKIAIEVTLVISGEIEMKGQRWREGDIIVLEQGEISSFKALTDATNVVVKLPGVIDDKYVVNEA